MTSELRQLEEMRQAAHGLGLGFAQAAQAEGDLDRKLLLFDAFQRGFASVRLSIALAMRLRSEARRPAPTEPAEHEDERAEAPERPDPPERPERYDERERERDRDSERASLPLLLRTLTSVADDARALTPQAAELPTLTELLDRVRAQPATPSPHPSPPSSSALRARLAGGTAALTLSPPPRGPLPGLPGAAPRRSTGPP